MPASHEDRLNASRSCLPTCLFRFVMSCILARFHPICLGLADCAFYPTWCGIFWRMLTFSSHRLRDLFYPAGMQPTPALLDFAFPDGLIEAAKVYYVRSLGPPFKAPPPAGAEGDVVWYIDEAALMVLVARMRRPLQTMTYDEAEDALDDMHEQVEDTDVRQAMLKAFVNAVAATTGLTPEALHELRAYATAAGM